MTRITQQVIEEIVASHVGRPDRVLVALQDMQAHVGYIPEAAVGAIAKSLGVPEGEVLGVISFYSELRTTPPGHHRVCVCRGDSCAAVGDQHIAAAVETRLGVPPHSVTADGQFSYDTVYCLGNCALSPSISIDDEVYGRCTPQGVAQLLEGLNHG